MPARRLGFAMDLEEDASFTAKAKDGSAKIKKTDASSLESMTEVYEGKSEKEEPPQASIAFLGYT